MLENLNWPSLAQCRIKDKAITMFKIMLDILTDDILKPAPSNHCLRGHSTKLLQPTVAQELTQAFIHSSHQL